MQFSILPKIELHCHLNGSLTPYMIERLVAVHADPKLQEEYRSFSPEIGNISDFFPLFKFIYKLTQKPEYVVLMTQMVLDFFESDGCVYLELRSTPRSTPGMSKRDYVLAIMEGIKQFKGRMIVQYIASLDRRNSLEENLDTVHLAHQLLQEGYPVCGVDLCGDPEKGVFRETMLPALQLARQLGLKLTVHCAEIQGVGQETMEILELKPDRIGHGTFLDEVSRQYLVDCSIPVEICMTSNVMCKTVKDYEDHHFYDLHYEGHPLILCTDDVGIFGSTLSNEYRLCQQHFGLTHEQILQLSRSSVDHIFASHLKQRVLEFFPNDASRLVTTQPQ